MKMRLAFFSSGIGALFIIFTSFSSAASCLLHNPPIIDFEASYLCYGTKTHFTNATISTSALSYTWTIFAPVAGGSTTVIFSSNQKDIDFLFPAKETYTVELKAFNGHEAVLARVLKIGSEVKAAYDYYNCQSHFTNLSTCTDSFFWDFGDGKTSTQKSPTHEYAFDGTARPKLVAYGQNAKDSAVGFINTYVNSLTAKFSHSRIKDSVEFALADTIQMTSQLIDFIWAWGDGTSTILHATGKKVKHLYPRLGRDTSYTVFLVERTLCFTAYSQSNVFVHDSTIVQGTHIFPNPCNALGFVKIETDNKKDLKEISLHGCFGEKLPIAQVIEKTNGFDLNISTLPEGVYTIILHFNTETIIKRILKLNN